MSRLLKTFLYSQPRPVYNSLLCALFFALVFLYMYFLSMSVVHVVLRKEINQTVNSVESQIAALEASYIESQHIVSNKMAALDTLEETEAKIFVSRSANTPVLTDARR